jgi:hypothetical protein
MSIFDLAAFDRTPLQHDPCDFLIVPNFVGPEHLDDLNRDYPRIDGPGSFAANDVLCGPSFSKLFEELRSPILCDHFSRKFGVDLSALPLQIGIRRFAELSDGNIHNDSRSKFVTALIYFNEAWESDAGRLRLLRDPNDIESHVAEIEPTRGTLLAFRRSETSYHGFKSCEGERRSLQMYWVNRKRGLRGRPKRTPEIWSRFKRLLKTG